MKILKTIRHKDFGFDVLQVEKYTERNAVRGIIFDKDRNIAFLRSKDRLFGMIPGGGVEEGEQVIDALRREMKEEIGCEISNIRELGIIEEFLDKLSLHQLSYCFIAEVKGEKGEPSLTEDELSVNYETLWFSFDDAISFSRKELETTLSYRGRFVCERDIFCLNKLKEII